MEGSSLAQLLARLKPSFSTCIAAKNDIQGLIQSSELPLLIITNTQNSWQKGQHWLAIFISEGKPAEFFDSFGLEPNHYSSRYVDFLINNSMDWKKRYSFNTCQIQNSD